MQCHTVSRSLFYCIFASMQLTAPVDARNGRGDAHTQRPAHTEGMEARSGRRTHTDPGVGVSVRFPGPDEELDPDCRSPDCIPNHGLDPPCLILWSLPIYSFAGSGDAPLRPPRASTSGLTTGPMLGPPRCPLSAQPKSTKTCSSRDHDQTMQNPGPIPRIGVW